ncbi:hypothetical protein K502DRAFT_104833 [Neoconidiobolus thromboides FSU 785]|nr:hypothetical protein K502DRAFT_104833 [Neoconidiobolus thromboides FSU 785]
MSMRPNLTITTSVQEIKCDSCYRLKIVCDRMESMCSGCFQRGILCTYTQPNKSSITRNLSYDNNQRNYINRQIVNRNLSVDNITQRNHLNNNNNNDSNDTNNFVSPKLKLNSIPININTRNNNNNNNNRNLSIDIIPLNNNMNLSMDFKGNSYPPPNLTLSQMVPNLSINRSQSPMNLTDLNSSYTSSPIYQSPTGTSPNGSFFMDNYLTQEIQPNLSTNNSSPNPMYYSNSLNNNNTNNQQTMFFNSLNLSPAMNANAIDSTVTLCQSPNTLNPPTIILEPPQPSNNLLNSNNSLLNNNNNSNNNSTNSLSSSLPELTYQMNQLTIENANFIFPETMLPLDTQTIIGISYYFQNIHPQFPVVDPILFKKKLALEAQLISPLNCLIEAIISLSKMHLKNPLNFQQSIDTFLTQVNLEPYFPQSNTLIPEEKSLSTATYLIDQLHSFHFANSLEF